MKQHKGWFSLLEWLIIFEVDDKSLQLQLMLSQHGWLHVLRWLGQLSLPVDANATTAAFGKDSSVLGKGGWSLFRVGLTQQNRW